MREELLDWSQSKVYFVSVTIRNVFFFDEKKLIIMSSWPHLRTLLTVQS